MKPAPFDYVRIDRADEIVDALREYGDEARILAGGQSLMAMLNFRLAQPQVLIDISHCTDLDYVRVSDHCLCIGAAATQARVEWRASLATEVPLLSMALPAIAHFQIRNRGTVCGSIAFADPSAELPLCLTALGGQVVLRSRSGQRVVDADAFFTGMLTTAITPGEFVEEARFPLAADGCRYAFDEVSLRHGDFAIVAVAAGVTDADIVLTVGGVADRPTRRKWPRMSEAELEIALNDFAWALQAQSDSHASATYRRHLVRGLGRQLVSRAQNAEIR